MAKQDIGAHSRKNFFDKQVHQTVWKNAMTGNDEVFLWEFLEELGYKKDIDFFSQYPIACMYVLDVAFPNLKLNIEIDGESHLRKKQKMKDRERDNYLYINNWVVIRCTKLRVEENYAFYRILIEEVILERERESLSGELHKDNNEFKI